jgi:hypothetical protein
MRQTGLLRSRYNRSRLIYGTLPEKLKTEMFPLIDCPITKNKRLKKHSKMKALKISGDLPFSFSPSRLYVLFL